MTLTLIPVQSNAAKRRLNGQILEKVLQLFPLNREILPIKYIYLLPQPKAISNFEVAFLISEKERVTYANYKFIKEKYKP